MGMYLYHVRPARTLISMCPSPNPSEVTQLLHQWQDGDDGAGEHLFRTLYQTLHDMAERAMRGERADHTLQPTALVNEAYLRLAGSSTSLNDRRHLQAVAARVMRRLLVDHARAKGREKRGGGRARVTFDERLFPQDADLEIELFEAAMVRLEAFDERKARWIELRHLAGLSGEEIAKVEGVSERTVRRELRLARAWLEREMGVGKDCPTPGQLDPP